MDGVVAHDRVGFGAARWPAAWRNWSQSWRRSEGLERARGIERDDGRNVSHDASRHGSRHASQGRQLGAYGEAAAARYLEQAGYRIIDRNWVCRDPDLRGELDLIGYLRRTLVVFEVKTRSTNRLAHPAEAVTRAKAIRLRRLAVRWLSTQRRRPGGQRLVRRMTELRIDVIAICARPGPPFEVLALDHLIGVA